MTFSIYALLGAAAPATSNEALATQLTHHFRDQTDFSLKFEQLPFAKNKTLALRWGSWLVRVSYEEGKAVVEDSAEIARILASAAPPGIDHIDRRIRLVFGDDEKREHTNEIIYLLDFVREIPGVVMFDPQQKDLVP